MKILEILRSTGLKTATQHYKYEVGAKAYEGQNAYGILHAPRGDATEAIVLVAALRNMDDESNLSGVALALTLARYFKRGLLGLYVHELRLTLHRVVAMVQGHHISLPR